MYVHVMFSLLLLSLLYSMYQYWHFEYISSLTALLIVNQSWVTSEFTKPYLWHRRTVLEIWGGGAGGAEMNLPDSR